jgi:hypothetical protein
MPGSVVVPYHFPGAKLNRFMHWDEPLIKVQVEKV